MKIERIITLVFFFSFLTLLSCKNPIKELEYENPDVKIIFLHHSTGNNVWYGDVKQGFNLTLSRPMCMVPRIINEYNLKKNKRIAIKESYFPSGSPYPWSNDPYDYYNIWVKNAGEKPYMEEPTLEILTKEFDVIIFKHCFPMSNILEDDGAPDINSPKRTIANYKLQYNAIKNKLHEFPDNKFIIWTGAALVESRTNADEAERAKYFSSWVKEYWDEPDDNIEIFDFRHIETQGGLYLNPEYAEEPDWDSHPNRILSMIAAKAFAEKIIEILD